MAHTNFQVNAADHYQEHGFVRITWQGAPSVNHYSYRVYRLDPNSAVWKLVRERSDTAANYTYDDYSAPSGTVNYTVVEVNATGNVQTEEAKSSKAVELYSAYYWLIHPTDPSKNIQLRGITGEEFQDEVEFQSKNLINRGRKIDVGDSFGKTGTLTGRIYDRAGKTARETRHEIEEAAKNYTEYTLRNPFGDMWRIWFSSPKFSRIPGVGQSEYVDMSFEYWEVA